MYSMYIHIQLIGDNVLSCSYTQIF